MIEYVSMRVEKKCYYRIKGIRDSQEYPINNMSMTDFLAWFFQDGFNDQCNKRSEK